MAANIVFLDIETAPSLGWVWGKWQQDVIAFEQSWYLLSFGYKYLDDPSVTVKALPDYKGYSKNREDDSRLVHDLWAVLDTADIIIAHNGDAFDLKKSNARFVAHGLVPPSPYKTVDTLKLARKYFKFESNSLNELGQHLELGRKIQHPGFDLWRGCMKGDLEAWNKMKEYNAQDVALLEKVYYKLRPWAASHPNLNLYNTPPEAKLHAEVCPTCGSGSVQRRGFSFAKTQIRQRWHCTSCGSWHSGEIIKKTDPAKGKK